MERMQFRDFTFPHNPEKIAVVYDHRIHTNYYPFIGEKNHSLGKRLRKITCSGAFFGKTPATAQAQLEGLLKTADDDQSGLLFIPGMAPISVLLKECAMELQQDGCVIPYTLLFWEEGDLS